MNSIGHGQGSLVLLSGGIDSATTLAIARSRSKQVYAITFDYGQRHRCELEAARAVAKSIGVVRHLIFPVDLRPIGGSALTDDIAVPKNVERRAESTEIPITYVPARNTIFLSIALAWAETLGVKSILIGANAVDYSGYPDCRPEFIRAFEQLANLATRIGVEGHDLKIEAPLMDLHKAEIIRKGTTLGVDYSQTISCYDPSPDGRACGSCDSCRIRRQGFADAGVADPTRYK